MTCPAPQNLWFEVCQIFRQFPVPLVKQHFARDQDHRHFLTAKSVAHGANRRERFAAACGVFENAASALRLPTLERRALVRAEHLASRAACPCPELLRRFNLPADLVDQVRPALRVRMHSQVRNGRSPGIS